MNMTLTVEQQNNSKSDLELRDALFVCLIQINVLIKILGETNILAQDRLKDLRGYEGIANDQLLSEMQRQNRLKIMLIRSEEILISVKKSLGI